MRCVLALSLCFSLFSCTDSGGGGGSAPAPGAGQKLPSDAPVRQLVGSPLAETPDDTRAVALADIDGDGDRDLVVGNDGEDRVYMNSGAGKFVGGAVLAGKATGAIAIAEINGDSAPDIVVGYSSDQPARVFLNQGEGKFEASAFAGPNYVSAIATLDVDSDGDMDVVFGRGGNAARQNHIYLNENGVLSPGAKDLPADVDFTVAIIHADVNSDGIEDLLMANETADGGRDRVYLSDGRGGFVSTGPLPTRGGGSRSIAVGDINGDNFVDLVVGGRGANSIYIGDGSGRFVDESVFRLPAHSADTSSVRLFDADIDNDLDLLVVNERAASLVYLNDGSGRFAETRSGGLNTELDRAKAIAVGDVDGDGDDDLIVGNDGTSNSLYLSEGLVNFVDASRAPVLGTGDVAIGFADVDGDNDSDIIKPNEGRVLVNDGRGNFVPQPMPKSPDTVVGSESTDVDGDGDLDLILATKGRTRLLVREGGRFVDETAKRLPDDSNIETRAHTLLDIDGDGDLDLYLANKDQDRLFVSDGRGNFADETPLRLPANLRPSRAVVAADIDGDGDPDLIVGGEGPTNAAFVYENTDKGKFTVRESLDIADVGGLAFGDVDDDGDLDLAVTRRATPALTGVTQIFRNDGTVFTRIPFPSRDGDPTLPVFGDVDGDGDADLVVAGNPTEVYLGNANGVFVDATRVFFPDALVSDIVRLVDVDDDQDLDMIAVHGEKVSLRYGLKYQIFAKEPPRLGKAFTVEIWANAGYAPNGQLVVPYLGGPALKSLRGTPFGTWHLDLASFVVLDALPVAAPAGEAKLVMPIPPATDLVGVVFGLQVLVANGASFEQWRLSNVWLETILR